MPFFGEYAPGFQPLLYAELTVDSQLKRAPEHETTKVEVERVKLRDLPNIMRKMGWDVAAQLMDRWFSGENYTLTKTDKEYYDDNPLSIPPARYDDSTVTMAWAEQFARFTKEHKKLLEEWKTPKSIEEIEKCISKAGFAAYRARISQASDKKEQQGVFTLGNISTSARELHQTCQVQLREFGGIFYRIDGMYGALGKAHIYLAVVGRATLINNGNAIFTVDHFGTYIKDAYEFNGDQPLGYWSKDKAYGKAEIISHLQYQSRLLESYQVEEFAKLNDLVIAVHNHDFREWRKLHNKGGDFVIYSDVKWTPAPAGTVIPITV